VGRAAFGIGIGELAQEFDECPEGGELGKGELFVERGGGVHE
jgi:hypothetical protein